MTAQSPLAITHEVSPGAIHDASSWKPLSTTAVPDSAMEKRPARRLRSACDACHDAKMKCSGGEPCNNCAKVDTRCAYSYTSRLGRPKGAKNKANPTANNGTKTTGSTSSGSTGQDVFSFGELGVPADTLAPHEPPFMPWGITGQEMANFMDNVGAHAHMDVHLTDTPALEDFTPPLAHARSGAGATLRSPFAHAPPDATPIRNGEFASTRKRGSIGCGLRRSVDGFSARNCGCIQAHAKFFARLKGTERSPDVCPISTTLDAAKQWLELWQERLACEQCKEDEDDAARMLLLLSARTILRRFRIELLNRPRFLKARKPGSTPSSVDKAASEASSGSRSVKIGQMELSADDQVYVMNMLVVRTVSDMKVALASANDSSERVSAWPTGMDWHADSESGGSDDGALHTLMDGIGESIRDLERLFEDELEK